MAAINFTRARTEKGKQAARAATKPRDASLSSPAEHVDMGWGGF